MADVARLLGWYRPDLLQTTREKDLTTLDQSRLLPQVHSTTD